MFLVTSQSYSSSSFPNMYNYHVFPWYFIQRLFFSIYFLLLHPTFNLSTSHTKGTLPKGISHAVTFNLHNYHVFPCWWTPQHQFEREKGGGVLVTWNPHGLDFDVSFYYIRNVTWHYFVDFLLDWNSILLPQLRNYSYNHPN